MSLNLSKEKCIPCEGSTKPLQGRELSRYLASVKKWKLIGRKMIEREILCKNFKRAIYLINEVGKVAEEQGHHPNIFLYSFNKVKLTLFTHAINGLSKNDFIVAAKIDQLLGEKS